MPRVSYGVARESIVVKRSNSIEAKSSLMHAYESCLSLIHICAELPASYFKRLKLAGTPIEKHLLVDYFAADTDRLVFDVDTYRQFRDERADRIWVICDRTVNPETVSAKALV